MKQRSPDLFVRVAKTDDSVLSITLTNLQLKLDDDNFCRFQLHKTYQKIHFSFIHIEYKTPQI